MAEKNNAVCDVCGKEYYVCLSCSDAMKLHPYKSFTDTAEHYKVFQVVKGFLTDVYTKDEAKERLQNVDLKDADSFKPHIKKILKDILEEEKVVVDTAKKIEDAVVEDIKEVEDTEIVEDIVKPIVSRKRNYKVEVE